MEWSKIQSGSVVCDREGEAKALVLVDVVGSRMGEEKDDELWDSKSEGTGSFEVRSGGRRVRSTSRRLNAVGHHGCSLMGGAGIREGEEEFFDSDFERV